MAAAAPVTWMIALSPMMQEMTKMHGQLFSLVSSGWLAAGQPAGSGSAAGRVALVAIALLAVGAFAVLQISNRSNRRRPPPDRRGRPGPSDWRTPPPPYWPAGRDGEVPPGNEERHRPDWKYGYPPGYDPYPAHDPARSPWAARDDATRGPRSLGGAGRAAIAAGSCLTRTFA